ncbi:MAG TPA: UDP binding domain-containing protein, partial [Patescibacteria group bacterium]|nr:UDP binding domain-containing protein [Patescibacteria group bacterium]
YLVYKAEMEGIHPQLISAARRINDGMAPYVASQIVKMMINVGITISSSRILVMGGTFKEDVKDSRNSKVTELIHELYEYGIEVYLYEPTLSFAELGNEFHIDQKHFVQNLEKLPKMDGICYAVDHKAFHEYSLTQFKSLCKNQAAFFDVKGRFNATNVSSLFVYKSL